MPGNKSPGVDKIPLRIYKKCSANILTPLTNIINQMFETYTFPDKEKIAEVIPHQKKAIMNWLLSPYIPDTIDCQNARANTPGTVHELHPR